MSKNLSFNELIATCKTQCQHPVDFMEPEQKDALANIFATMAEMLTPMFLFMGKARTRQTAGDRLWVVLYVVRPDLNGGETVAAYASRVGLRETHLWNLVAEFRAMIPNFTLGRVHRHRVLPTAGRLAQVSTPTPP